jgi:FAD/FMN-containing dehydrogenase
LGLEVVLPDGTLISGLRRLRKNNAGYDWKQLFISAEGTLGIVTAAVIRLTPQPKHKATALLEVADPARALDLLSLAQGELGDQISAFELISPDSVALLRKHLGLTAPVGSNGWPVLLEAASSISGLRDTVMSALEAALEKQIASDGVIAESESQAASLWNLGEHITCAPPDHERPGSGRPSNPARQLRQASTPRAENGASNRRLGFIAIPR